METEEPTTQIFIVIKVLDEYTKLIINFKKSLELLINKDTIDNRPHISNTDKRDHIFNVINYRFCED